LFLETKAADFFNEDSQRLLEALLALNQPIDLVWLAVTLTCLREVADAEQRNALLATVARAEFRYAAFVKDCFEADAAIPVLFDWLTTMHQYVNMDDLIQRLVNLHGISDESERNNASHEIIFEEFRKVAFGGNLDEADDDVLNLFDTLLRRHLMFKLLHPIRQFIQLQPIDDHRNRNEELRQILWHGVFDQHIQDISKGLMWLFREVFILPQDVVQPCLAQLIYVVMLISSPRVTNFRLRVILVAELLRITFGTDVQFSHIFKRVDDAKQLFMWTIDCRLQRNLNKHGDLADLVQRLIIIQANENARDRNTELCDILMAELRMIAFGPHILRIDDEVRRLFDEILKLHLRIPREFDSSDQPPYIAGLLVSYQPIENTQVTNLVRLLAIYHPIGNIGVLNKEFRSILQGAITEARNALPPSSGG